VQPFLGQEPYYLGTFDPPSFSASQRQHPPNRPPQPALRFTRKGQSKPKGFTMFNLAQNPKLRGSGLLILNALRAFTVIGLGVAIVACWVMIVLSGLRGNFDFFDCATHFFVSGVAVFLIMSEFCLFRRWFEATWPVLSPSHSLSWLGLALIMIGCSIMADLTKPAYSVKNLGLPMWRLVISAGILSITFGFFNIIASLVFWDREGGITARHIRSHGSLAAPTNNKEYYEPSYSQGYSHQHHRGYPSSQGSGSGGGGGGGGGSSFHQPEEEDEYKKPSGIRRLTQYFVDRRKSKMPPQISKPIISHPQPPSQYDSDVERGAAGAGGGDDVLNDRRSPIIPGLTKPPSVLHPANRHRYSPSHYSTAEMDRFTEYDGHGGKI